MSPAMAGEADREDLSACTLPTGTALIPQRDSPKAEEKGGYIFRFSDQKLSVDPLNRDRKKPKSVEDFCRAIRDEGTGDLMYSQGGGAHFIAFSGRIRDLGESLLYTFSGKELERPQQVAEVEEDKEAIPGSVAGVAEGHSYLVETLDGKFALVRLISKEDRAAKIQWVYQPDGSRKFSIPQGKLLPPGSDRVVKKAPDHAPKPAEDLSKCKLPHGTAMLAKEYSPKSHEQKGSFFKFSDEKLYFGPYATGKNPKPGLMLQMLHDKHTGDVFYFSYKGGGLVSVSGRIAHLGEHFLWEFDRKELPRPEIGNYWSEDRDRIAGVANPVETGHCYLVETVDGKFALVRVVSIDDLGFATVQWVYQPDGTRTFSIPKGEPTPPKKEPEQDKAPEAAAIAVKSVTLREVDMEKLDAAIEAHLANRTTLVEALLSFLKESTEKDLRKMSNDQQTTLCMAVEAIGVLRAPEGTSALLDRITLADSTIVSDELSMSFLVSVSALEKIGKPSTTAILSRLREGVADKDAETLKAFQSSAELALYCRVLGRVEGKDVAEFILKSEMEEVGGKGLELYQKAAEQVKSVTDGAAPEYPHIRHKAQGELGNLQEAIRAHLDERDALVEVLLTRLRENIQKEPLQKEYFEMQQAIATLGRIRASSAVETLLDIITFHDPTTTSRHPENPFSSLKALVCIGKPATYAVLRRLQGIAASEDKDAWLVLERSSELSLYCRLLLDVEGRAVAEFILKSEMEKVKEERRGVYLKALELVKGQ